MFIRQDNYFLDQVTNLEGKQRSRSKDTCLISLLIIINIALAVCMLTLIIVNRGYRISQPAGDLQAKLEGTIQRNRLLEEEVIALTSSLQVLLQDSADPTDVTEHIKAYQTNSLQAKVKKSIAE